MNKKIIDQIKKAAARDAKNRKDIRFKRAMALLTRKGFLKTNVNFDRYYVRKLNIKDVVWAGQNVEPRILEVLPAAAARLPKAFILGANKETVELNKVIHDLRENKIAGADFFNMPYTKVKQWMNIPLNDKRTKPTSAKKKMQSFRLNQEAIDKMKLYAEKKGVSDSVFLEELIRHYDD